MDVAVRQEENLWVRFKEGGDMAARADLIESHAPLVKHIAGRLAVSLPSHIDYDDLVGYGVFGLIDALEKFDYRRGVKFKTYAYTRIKGAILDGLRAYDWAPSTLRKRANEVEDAYARLEARLGRAATDWEMAEELGLSVEEFQQLLGDIDRAAIASLDGLWGHIDSEGHSLAFEVIENQSSPDPETVAWLNQRKRLLAEAIDRLPEKERLVVALYYYEELTGKEISEIMDLSQSRISQLHSKAILRLRGGLSQESGVML